MKGNENMSQESNQEKKASEQPTKPAKNNDLFDQVFTIWEKRTSEYFERLLRSPGFLNTMGGVMNSGYRNKIFVDRALSAVWRNLNLPNKQDQERTLHLLNELHSRIYDLEERLARQKREEGQATGAEAADSGTKGRNRRSTTSDLKSAGAE
jgi:hypothetical protein